jgi:hypothetical protein
MSEVNRYAQIIAQIFLNHFKEGAREVPFEREEIARVAKAKDCPAEESG